MTTAEKPLILLWLNEAAPYHEAAAQAGLADRVELRALRLDELPSPELLARCEAMLAWRAGAGVLSRAPRLRWIQTQTAGVEGWLTLPDLPAGVILSCARGTHRVQMSELHPERDRIVAGLWVENLRRFLDGRDLLEVVNHARGY